MVICVGWLQWLPFAASAGYGLGKKLGWWGGDKPRPPDINAERFQYDNKWLEDWTKSAKKSATVNAERFLGDAMKGINRSAGTRGLYGTGYVEGAGGGAAELSAEKLANMIAEIEGQAAGMEHTGMMQGQQLYADEYQKYLDQMYQDQDDWIAQMFSLIPNS